MCFNMLQMSKLKKLDLIKGRGPNSKICQANSKLIVFIDSPVTKPHPAHIPHRVKVNMRNLWPFTTALVR